MSVVKNVVLTPEQEKTIVDIWNSRKENPPSVVELIKLVFNIDNADARCSEARTIRKFLGQRQMKFRSLVYQKQKPLELSEENKEYIANNCPTMSPVEMTRVIFNNSHLSHVSLQCRAVRAYLDELNPAVRFRNEKEENSVEEKYSPPKTSDRAISRINLYVHHQIDKTKLTPKQKKEIDAIIGYLNTYRFLHQINTYNDRRDRDLFESEIVRCCYDKSDLTQEEVDQYITYSSEVVILANIQRRKESVQMALEECSQNSETEKIKISMSLVELVGKLEAEHNSCVKRQNDLLDALKENRSKRLSKEHKETASVLNLVALWKDEETRNQMIAVGMKGKDALKEEVTRLSEMEELKAKIMGLTAEEFINGQSM